ncbi:MAG TPA: quinol:electron acceptor oxidoreductase subunit ActD [Bryobacteraceae bacterium]|nr:quinol:electron acceptor oxidoreductase subunit ActD [Bryobacteraceae bacterium]
MFLTAEFADAQSVAQAIASLRAQGFDGDQMDVFSTEPVEITGGLLDRPTHMSLTAVASAASFCLLAFLFVRYAQYDYPVVTGGMPIFSWWANGVIFYEFTMFGSITATFVMFLVESGLLTRRAPAPVLVAGRILLRISCEARRAAVATECLRQAGATGVAELRG